VIHAPIRPKCWRHIRDVPASVRIDKVPYCRDCARELVAKPGDLKIEPVSDRRLALSTWTAP
jgi:hypothetical protein